MSNLKTIIIAVVIIIAGFFAYSYIFLGDKDNTTGLKDVSGNTPAGTNTAATASSAGGASAVSSSKNDIYVKQLSTLSSIDFKFNIFMDEAYLILHISDTDIPDQPKGRHNPFAPIDGTILSDTNSSLGGNFLTNSQTTGSSSSLRR